MANIIDDIRAARWHCEAKVTKKAEKRELEGRRAVVKAEREQAHERMKTKKDAEKEAAKLAKSGKPMSGFFDQGLHKLCHPMPTVGGTDSKGVKMDTSRFFLCCGDLSSMLTSFGDGVFKTALSNFKQDLGCGVGLGRVVVRNARPGKRETQPLLPPALNQLAPQQHRHLIGRGACT